MTIFKQMDMLKSFISTRYVFNACFALAWSMPVHAEISLDKLNACDELAQLYSSLKAKPFSTSSECREPNDALEKELISRTGGAQSKICLLPFSPSRILDGFTCLQTPVPKGTNLTCFRPARLADVDKWKHQYKNFAASESNYLNAASNCSTSNGDTAKAAATMAPLSLTYISRFQIGWISSLGSTSPADSSIVHGYASTDTSLSGNTPSAIEFLYMIVGTPPYSSSAVTKKVGNWIVNIDAAEEADKYYYEEVRRNKIPLKLDLTSFKLESIVATQLPMSVKQSFLSRLLDSIGDSLEEEGFKKISDRKLEESSGRDSKETIDFVMKNLPIGNPVKAALKLDEISVFVNERRPSCTKNGRGAIGAYIFSFQPLPDARDDYGNIGLIVAGLGNCSRASTSTQTYFDDLIEEATNQLLSKLPR